MISPHHSHPTNGVRPSDSMILPPLPLQREFAAFVAQAEKAKASLKESLAALTAAQKSLMNSSFAKAREDARVFLKEGTR